MLLHMAPRTPEHKAERGVRQHEDWRFSGASRRRPEGVHVQRRSWPESVRNSDLGPDLAALIGSIAANNFNRMGELHDFPFMGPCRARFRSLDLGDDGHRLH